MGCRLPVVTGLGVVSAAGSGVGEVWEALCRGRSGLGALTLFASARYAAHAVGQVRRDLGVESGGVRGSRSDQLTWIAAQEAIRQAGVDAGDAAGSSRGTGLGLGKGLASDRAGMVLGSTVAGMLGTEEVLRCLLREPRHPFGAFRFHECASATDLCARRLGLRGPTLTLSTACSAGALAIATAAELIENDEADLMLAGGADSLSRLTLNGFGSLLLLDPGGCRPFDVRRGGISLGEGAAILVLEAEATARARGACILARLSGWGTSCDASHATAPHPEADGATWAMQRALERSGLTPADISYVSAHGTGTPDNDAMEARALRRVFGEGVPPFASVMRFFGHTLAASGAIKAVICVQALREQAMPPTLGFETLDPAIGLEPVRRFEARPLAHVVSNSFGFGGNNVVLVFSPASGPSPSSRVRPELAVPEVEGLAFPSLGAGRPRSGSAPAALAVVGAGVLSPAGTLPAEVYGALRNGGVEPAPFELAAPFRPTHLRAYVCGELGGTNVIGPARRRRLGRLQLMTLLAAKRSLPPGWPGDMAPERLCAAVGTGFGCLGETAAFVENMVVNDERAPLAGRFANSVHNACSAQLAIEFQLRGLNSTPIHREISFEAALWQCARELARGDADGALAGAADELSPYLLAAGARWGWWDGETPAVRPFRTELSGRQRPLPGEGAAVFALVRGAAATEALARLVAVRFGRFGTRPDGRVDVAGEAAWICATLEREGVDPGQVDVMLTGANGHRQWDEAYLGVAAAFSARVKRDVRCGAYKQACGEYPAASGFGFLVGLGLVRGEVSLGDVGLGPIGGMATNADRPRTVLLYTLSPTGNRALCGLCG